MILRGRWLALGLVLGLGTAGVAAPQLRGAVAVLRSLPQPPAGTEPPPVPYPTLKREDLAPFRKRLASLPPELAAAEWLAYVERWLAAPPPARGADGTQLVIPLTAQDLLRSLPPPASWKPLAVAILRRPRAAQPAASELGLRMLAHTLRGDAAAQWQELRAMEALAARTQSEERSNALGFVLESNTALLRRTQDPQRIEEGVRRQVARQTGPGGNLPLPDLVRLLGEARAERLLRFVLVTSRVEVTVPEADGTGRVARRIALQEINRLPVPQWALTHSLEAGPLYEALVRRFVRRPARKGNSAAAAPDSTGTSREASAYYLCGMLASGRDRDAVAFLRRSGGEIDFPVEYEASFLALERAGALKRAVRLLGAQMGQMGAHAPWRFYAVLATRAGEPEAPLPVLRAALRRTGLSPERRVEIASQLHQALLVVDRTEEAVAVIRREILPARSTNPRSVFEREEGAALLCRLGKVLGRKDLVAEGLAGLRSAARDGLKNNPSWESTQSQVRLEFGGPAEAEAAVVPRLKYFATARVEGNPRNSSWGPLRELAEVYYRAGRPRDVLALFQHAADWQAPDLVHLLVLPEWPSQAGEKPIGFFAAWALAETGDPERAAAILEELLLERPHGEDAYRLLLKLRGTAALPFLERLHAFDPIQMQPLLWKAELLARLGRWEDAEQRALAVLALNPSDDARIPGRRNTLYTLLARIREQRGDAAEANRYRQRAAAVRLGDRADQLAESGLITRAVALYQDAVRQFPDDYALRARLAVRLVELGRLAAAGPHHRRAFELMPDHPRYIGRFCLECQALFRGPHAEALAAEVFGRAVRLQPQAARGHYFLGVLRQMQGRTPEALQLFQRAARLEPNRDGPWQEILNLGEGDLMRKAGISLPSALRDEALLRLVALDPRGLRNRRTLQSATDLRKLWSAMEKVPQEPAPRPATLLPLPASREAGLRSGYGGMEAEWLAEQMAIVGYALGAGMSPRRNTIPSPAAIVGFQELVTHAGIWLDKDKEQRFGRF